MSAITKEMHAMVEGLRSAGADLSNYHFVFSLSAMEKYLDEMPMFAEHMGDVRDRLVDVQGLQYQPGGGLKTIPVVVDAMIADGEIYLVEMP